jgi:hypothetical protein
MYWISISDRALLWTCLIYASVLYLIDYNRIHALDGLLFAHNLISAFGNLGWLSANPTTLTVYLMGLLLMVTSWALNGNLCFLTEWHNLACGRPRHHVYNDIFNMIGLKRIKAWNLWGHYLFACATFAYAAYKLYLLKLGKRS